MTEIKDVPANNRGAPGAPGARAREPKFYTATMRKEDGSVASTMLVRAKTQHGAIMGVMRALSSGIEVRVATPMELLAAGSANANIIDACKPEQAPLVLDPDSSAAEAIVAAGGPPA